MKKEFMPSRYLRIPFAILTAGLLASCSSLFGFGSKSSAGDSGSEASIEADTSKEVTVWWPSGSEFASALAIAQEAFGKAYPDITLKIVKKAGLDIYQSYLIALNDNKTRPDLAILDHVYIQNLAFENQIANISQLSAGDGIEKNFPASLYAANSYQGNSYALPLSANTVALMGNMEILAAAGITAMPTTYSEFLADCELIKTKTSYTPFAQPINNTFCAMEFSSYVARNKAKMVSDDYKTVTLNSEGVKAAVNDWVSLSKYASQNEYEEGKFYAGSIGFIEMGSWNLSKVTQGETSFTLGLSPIVTIDSATPNYSGLGLYSMAIAEKSSAKHSAYQFAKILATNKDFQIAFAKAKDLLPVTAEALGDATYTSDKYLSVYAQQMQNVAPRPGTPVWPTMEQQIVNMLYGAVTATNADGIQAAIDSAQSAVQAATDRKFNG